MQAHISKRLNHKQKIITNKATKIIQLKYREEKTMFTFIVITYLVIGLFIGLSNVSKGREGSAGFIPTIVGHMLLWPLFLLSK